MSTASLRRRRDRLIAAALAALMAGLAVVVYLRSDARATTLEVAADADPPTPMAVIPQALQQIWSLSSDPSFPAVASPYGSVVTAQGSTVTGHDAATGSERWSYARSNLPLCALASGDTGTEEITAGGSVRGILTGYAKGDRCSDITLLHPVTGDRRKQRTGFTARESQVVFGGPYGGMVSDSLVELWRYDLVRTIQYGDQPLPTKPNTKRLGCRMADAAVATTQFATLERCDGREFDQLVLNYADPGASTEGKSNNWDALRHEPRAVVDLGSTVSRILAVSAEQVLVLVAEPEPAAVLYDAQGQELARTPVSFPADDIAAAARAGTPTPVVLVEGARYLAVGTQLVAVRTDGMELAYWVSNVAGLPAVVGEDLLLPVADGLAVVSRADGAIARTVPVDRGGYTGRVDAAVVGDVVVESRAGTVVGLRDPALPAG